MCRTTIMSVCVCVSGVERDRYPLACARKRDSSRARVSIIRTLYIFLES